MKFNFRYFSELSFILLCMMPVTACIAETKQAQCQKVGDIINGFGSVNPSDIETVAKSGRLAASDLDSLELKDKKLSNLRSHLSKSMKASADAAFNLVDLIDPDGSFNDSPEAQKILKQNQQASIDFESKLNATQIYCSEGVAPEKLISQPAS